MIVTNSNDDRSSTAALREIAAALDRDPDVQLSVFLLRRRGAGNDTWPSERVVDDLRRWWPAVVADRILSPTVAGRLRGMRLRWWLHRADPDVVILDDGLGHRVIEHLRRRPVVVNRCNIDPPPGALDDTVPYDDPDLVIAPAGALVDRSTPVVREHRFWRSGAAARLADDRIRRDLRRRLGVAEDAVLVTGWGADGWLDGPDLFVRALWALEHRHEVAASGLWFGSQIPAEVRQLRSEADRCGIGDRFDVRPYDGDGEAPLDALCGDVVLLPTREALLVDHVMPASISGLRTVTFEVARIDDERVILVPDLDIEAAATALLAALDGDRVARSRALLDEVDVTTWSRHLIDVAVGEERRR